MEPQDYAYLYELEESFWWFAGMREITATLLLPSLPTKKNALGLDAGCGTGGMISWLNSQRPQDTLVGIDLVDSALKFSAQRRHQHLAQASVTDLPFADSVFDFVTSFDVLVQLAGKAEDERAIREMHRVMRPGAVCFVRVAAFEWMKSAHDAALGTRRRYSLSDLNRKLREAGFEIVRDTYANTLLFPIAAVHRLILKRLRLVNAGSDVKPWRKNLRWMNSAMTAALRLEAKLLRLTKFDFPFGLSAICVARKPLEPDPQADAGSSVFQ